jgi:hypothetical protein
MLFDLVKEMRFSNADGIPFLQNSASDLFFIEKSTIRAAQVVKHMSSIFRDDPAMLAGDGYIVQSNFIHAGATNGNWKC